MKHVAGRTPSVLLCFLSFITGVSGSVRLELFFTGCGPVPLPSFFQLGGGIGVSSVVLSSVFSPLFVVDVSLLSLECSVRVLHSDRKVGRWVTLLVVLVGARIVATSWMGGSCYGGSSFTSGRVLWSIGFRTGGTFVPLVGCFPSGTMHYLLIILCGN